MTNERVIHNGIFNCLSATYPKCGAKGAHQIRGGCGCGDLLTGYDDSGLQAQIIKKVDYETFFREASQVNPNAAKISGLICGHRVEEIKEPLMQKIRWLDKLVDELAKGKTMGNVLRL